jgi:hypothetical protein
VHLANDWHGRTAILCTKQYALRAKGLKPLMQWFIFGSSVVSDLGFTFPIVLVSNSRFSVSDAELLISDSLPDHQYDLTMPPSLPIYR